MILILGMKVSPIQFNTSFEILIFTKPETFHKLSAEEKLVLESQLLWKKYAVYFKVFYL